MVHNKQKAALNQELAILQKQEAYLTRSAKHTKPAAWKAELEEKIPPNVYAGLESAFCKSFSIVFKYGRFVIEKGYNKEELKAVHAIRDSAVRQEGGKKEFRQMHRSALQADFLNMAATTVEGIGLGALGVGMPDIILFLGTLLKGIYETALNYGFDYESRQEQMLILKMMEADPSASTDTASGILTAHISSL